MARKKLKISTGITYEKQIVKLIEEKGMEGFGIYIATLLEMKEKSMEQFNIMELQDMARRLKISRKKIEKAFHAHASTHAEAPAGACQEEEEKDMPDRHNKEIPTWEKYINQATEDTGWLEAVAMNNRLPIKNKLEEIMTIFKRHVRAQGSEKGIDGTQEAKRYFANYAREGTKTYKKLMEELAGNVPGRGSMRGEKDLHKYEDVNPITGERTYYGTPIPPEAPPRPTAQAVYVNGKWEA